MIGPDVGRPRPATRPRTETLVESARLRQLYEISRVLTRFSGLDAVFADVITVMSEIFPLRSAILRLQLGDGPVRSSLWHPEHVDVHYLRSAERVAATTWAYLAGRAATPPPIDAEGGAQRAGFITLPLVVARAEVFGVVLFDSVVPLAEPDLLFANIVVNQLAIALDRQARIDAAGVASEGRREQAEARRDLAERLQVRSAFLAELGVSLADSLSQRATLATMARLIVPTLADGCFIDFVGDDARVERLEPVFADPSKQALVPDVQRLAPRPGWTTPQAEVLAGGPGRLVDTSTPAALDAVARDADHRAVLAAIGVRSMLVVPLTARGRMLGVLTLFQAESGRRHDAEDLDVAADVARRAAITLDNTHLYEQAQRAIGARQDVLAVVSHDLRNPLSTIMMATEHLRSMEPDGSVLRKRLDMIHRSSERMSRMIGDLLDIANLENGQLSMSKGWVPVATLMTDAIELQREMASAKSIRLEVIGTPCAAQVYGDRERILQVFGNLIGNAIKFTPSGGVIAIDAELVDDAIRFRVADSGCGIPADQVHRVFERYWRGRTSGGGSGLGLAISRGIVEAHGGTIGVTSEVGVGTTLCFTVPLASGPRE